MRGTTERDVQVSAHARMVQLVGNTTETVTVHQVKLVIVTDNFSRKLKQLKMNMRNNLK